MPNASRLARPTPAPRQKRRPEGCCHASVANDKYSETPHAKGLFRMITLYHAPRSRSSRIIWLLEELGCEYKIEIVPIKRGDGTGEPAPDSYLAINPLRKVPAIKVFDEIVTESAGICLYLTDSHQKHAMGPLPGANDRAEYVRWLFFYTGALEPAATARFQGWDKEKPTGFGTLEDIEAVISAQLEKTPYLLGDT